MSIRSAIETGFRSAGSRSVLKGALALVLCLSPAQAESSELTDAANEWRVRLVEQILPYWYDTTLDAEHGGFLLADQAGAAQEVTSKQLVTQTRMIWTFSAAHRAGFRDAKRDYLAAAAQGYRFLTDHFLDPESGGYYWETKLDGEPVNHCKFLYGQSFVVYALVEYSLASGERAPIDQAMTLFRAINQHLHDPSSGGWMEHADRDWQWLPAEDPRNAVEIVGYKSANAHLHWMEALAELYAATNDAQVRSSLEEALRLNRTEFYPLNPGESCFHRTAQWARVRGSRSDGLSYGHNVEFAWLMLRAQEALGETPDWGHFYAHINHALAHGYDTKLGGLYNRGMGDQPATDTRKVWWVQAEWVAALTTALQHDQEARHTRALLDTLSFVSAQMADPRDGVWLDTVSRDGKPVSRGKAHNWKGAYHDVRALLMFTQAFAATASP